MRGRRTGGRRRGPGGACEMDLCGRDFGHFKRLLLFSVQAATVALARCSGGV
nr:MAG TPA: hypothetical protein [Bacteriophage sp.]